MKKIFVFLCLSLLLVGALFAGGCNEVKEENFLRIHIRADSNDPDDQAVKLKVRDAVISYLTPVLSQVNSVEEAIETVKSHLEKLRALAETVLKNNGYRYGAKVSVRRERFPTKKYGDLTLLAGVYDAIVFELGSGRGDNWWCIAYPTFCFVPHTDETVYRSLIKELYEKWRKNE